MVSLNNTLILYSLKQDEKELTISCIIFKNVPIWLLYCHHTIHNEILMYEENPADVT
jgi:uncharacterized protein with ParB-like and HNH nuclease domain